MVGKELIGHGDAGLTFDMVSFFKSTVQTGTGASASVAHGLSRVPKLTLTYPVQNAAGTFNWTVSEGTPDSINHQVSATSGLKYVVFAS